jgi:protein-S-isoprenylcysteine O-methyltransferase Ste14
VSSDQREIYQRSWVTDKAYISGLAGIFMLFLLAYLYQSHQVFEFGISVFGSLLIEGRSATSGFALCLITLFMVIVELVRLWYYDKTQFLSYSPLWINKQYFTLFYQAGKKYLLNLILIALAFAYYSAINEYGYRVQATYYQPWFQLFEKLCLFYLCLGLPYQFITQAFKHDSREDVSDLLAKILSYLCAIFHRNNKDKFVFQLQDRKNVLSFLVKLFFAPIMTVFFFDNFYHLINNITYMTSGILTDIQLGNYSHKRFNLDLSNIIPTIIFSIDVALAWCGYIVSSRWLDNQTISTEPTLLGWCVCLLSYPPFRVIPAWLFTTPGEKMYLQLPDQILVTCFGLLLILSYFLYMLPTIYFGVRFSNLTNRGIIRRGPFAIVRHPAYAAKNLAWWFVGLPVAIYSGYQYGFITALMMIIGLVFMTGIYYLRAITEEKHLGIDPQYQAYCTVVKYRFIPKVW